MNTFRVPLQVGMPLTGQNNLSEGPLLRHLGHIRWEHLSRILEIPTKQIVDAHGERVYATFFFIDMTFTDALPINGFVENDEIEVVSTLRRHETFLDGELYLFPSSWSPEQKTTPESPQDALARGIPVVTMGNSFVLQFKGADWLKKAAPAAPELARIPETGVPGYFADLLDAKSNGRFFAAPDDFAPLTSGESEVSYELVPERDINGVGLLYFANYPVITDICERIVLTSILGDTGPTSALMAGRMLVQRRSGFFGNANVRDSLRLGISAWAKSEGNEQDGYKHHLVVNARMHRKSDGRLMYVTSTRKVISHHEAELYAAFSRRASAPGAVDRTSPQYTLRLPVDALPGDTIVLRADAGHPWTVGQDLRFRVDTPNGATDCHGKVDRVRNEEQSTYVTVRILDLPPESPLADYLESSMLRQMCPPSTLNVTLEVP